MGFRPTLEGVPRESILVVGLVSGSHVLNHLYLVLFPPVLTVLAVEFDVGLTELGIAMGVGAFVNMLLQLPYGYLADAYDRTITLALCLGLASIGGGILAVAPSFEWLLIGQAVLGAGISAHHPAHFPLLSDSTDQDFRGKAYSIHGLAGNLGFAAPPVVVLGVMSLPGATWRHAFGLIAVVSALYGIIACYVLSRHVSDEITRPNANSEDESTHESWITRGRAELHSIGQSPPILGLGLVTLLLSTAIWGLTSYVAVVLEEAYGAPTRLASLTITAMFVMGAVLILFGGALADRFRPGIVVAGAYGFVGIALVLFSTMLLPWQLAIVVAIIAGSVGSLGLPARDKLADALSSPTDLGRNFAIITIGLMIGNTISPPLFGAIIESTGYQSAFIGIAVAAFLASLTALAIVARYRGGIVSESRSTARSGT